MGRAISQAETSARDPKILLTDMTVACRESYSLSQRKATGDKGNSIRK